MRRLDSRPMGLGLEEAVVNLLESNVVTREG